MIADLIVKVAQQNADPDHEYRRRPSSAGPERCIRQMVYHARGEEAAALPGRALLIFDDSSWHEELTFDWIAKTTFTVHSRQMKVMTKAGEGRIDGIVTDILSGDRLLEHKAINHFGFERIWKGDYPLDYLSQTALYLEGLQNINPDMCEAILLIKNKNTAQYMEFLLAYDRAEDSLTIVEAVRSDGESYKPNFIMQKITAAAVEKFDLVDKHLIAKTLPDRPFEFGTTFPCDYCRWKIPCWGNYAEEFGKLSTDAELDQEAETLFGYYVEKKAQISDMEDEADQLKAKINTVMTAAKTSKARAGDYIANVKLVERTAIDKSLMPEAIRKKYEKINRWQEIRVSKIKPPAEEKPATKRKAKK